MCSFAILSLPSCLCVLGFCGGLKAFGREGEYVVVVVFFRFCVHWTVINFIGSQAQSKYSGQETKSNQRVRHWIELLTSVFINRTSVFPLTLVILNWKFNWPACLCKILVLIQIFEETDGQYQYWSNQCILKSSQSNGRRKRFNSWFNSPNYQFRVVEEERLDLMANIMKHLTHIWKCLSMLFRFP